MDKVTYAPLTVEQFTTRSLDGFVLRQHVTRCWRRVDGALVLRPVEYIEDWTLEERRQFALELLTTLHPPRHGGAGRLPDGQRTLCPALHLGREGHRLPGQTRHRPGGEWHGGPMGSSSLISSGPFTWARPAVAVPRSKEN